MKKIISILLICISASATAQTNKNINAHFDAYKERFVLALWKQQPNWASSKGFHLYDSVLTIPTQSARQSDLQFCLNQQDSLKRFAVNDLQINNKTDFYLISSYLQSAQWYITTFKAYQWNPSSYNVCGDFAEMLENNYDSLDNRLRNYYFKMKNVPAYYQTAMQEIKNPTIEHTQLAISQNEGGLATFNADLKIALEKSNLSNSEKEKILLRANEADAAIKNYIHFLKTMPNPTPRSFRLGESLYNKKFELDVKSDYTAAQIYLKATAHKKELHAKMFVLTQKLWPNYMANKKMPTNKLLAIKQMIDTLSAKHVAADSFQTAIEKQIPILAAFINEKKLLYLDPSKPLVVRKEPAYMAGVAGASVSSPGPYDKGGNTYYNVGSFSGWDNARIESYLREYNSYILQILNIHEAIPGHYAQLVYANKSPSIIKSIFANGAMIEGWAVYTELMMLENGYGRINGNNEDEMLLMYYKWNLRSTCNTILDYDVHVNNLSKAKAINFLINDAFQQMAEAEGKWKRVSVSQVQLTSYFTGYTQIYDLRETIKKREGKNFDLKKFHEQFLSYGSIPVKYIKQLMLK